MDGLDAGACVKNANITNTSVSKKSVLFHHMMEKHTSFMDRLLTEVAKL